MKYEKLYILIDCIKIQIQIMTTDRESTFTPEETFLFLTFEMQLLEEDKAKLEEEVTKVKNGKMAQLLEDVKKLTLRIDLWFGVFKLLFKFNFFRMGQRLIFTLLEMD